MKYQYSSSGLPPSSWNDYPSLRKWLPVILDKKTATRVAHHGTWACLIIAVATVLFAQIVGTSSVGHYWYIEPIIYVLLAFGIYNMSRTAAIVATVLFILDRIVAIAQYGVKIDVILLFFVVAFYNAIRGTFEYHRLEEAKTTATTGEQGAREVDNALERNDAHARS